MTFFIKYLISEGGYTQLSAGRLFMLMGWLSLLCGLVWGWVSDVIGRKSALVIVYLLHTGAFGLFALWPSPARFTLSAVLFGLSAWSIPATGVSGDTIRISRQSSCPAAPARYRARRRPSIEVRCSRGPKPPQLTAAVNANSAPLAGDVHPGDNSADATR